VEVSGPEVIPSKKLLRSASVARTIPGLGVQRFKSAKKPSRSVTVVNRFKSRTHNSSAGRVENVQNSREFTFPDSAPHRIQLLQDTCANLFLAFISLAIAHFPMLVDSQLDLRSAGYLLTSHFFAADLGLVLVWGVLVTLIQQLLNQSQSAGERPLGEFEMEFKAVTLTALIMALALPLSAVALATPSMLLGATAFNFAGSCGRVAWKRHIMRSRWSAGKSTKNVLIAGAGQLGHEIAEYLSRHREHLRIVKGFLDENRNFDRRVLGGIDDLAEVARAQFVDEIIVALPRYEQASRTVIIEALRNHLDVRIIEEPFEPCALQSHDMLRLLPLHQEPLPELGLVIKRAMDVSFAALGLVMLLPLLALIAVLIRFDSPGPVLYRALRVGKKGHTFLCYKFRTMIVEADSAKEALRSHNERHGPTFKITNDPRITPVGRCLRRYSLDELPQLWNVLIGDMSLVGPRPHPLDDYQHYRLQHLRRLDVTPGITGLWQITARRDPSFFKNMELDLEYIDRWSLWEDLKILLRTLRVVLAGTGV
jgi:exopolysaccharide biosynthesis polyprenyl glycosylphosphotransferase